MMLVLEGVLPPPLAEVLREEAETAAFEDGRKTAGRFAREVKANDQATPSPTRDAILEKARAALMAPRCAASKSMAASSPTSAPMA